MWFCACVQGSEDFVSTARLFSCAAVVVGLHGAGMANVLFAPEGTAIVEINAGACARVPVRYHSSASGDCPAALRRTAVIAEGRLGLAVRQAERIASSISALR